MIGRHRDERGSILPMTVLLVAVVLTVTAFAVDLGVARVSRSDMQALSNVVALDLARHIEGRTKSAIEADPKWTQAKANSVARNNTTVGSPPAVTAELGKLDPATGVFSAVAASDQPTAVRVTAGSTVDYSFVHGKGTTSRSAIATVDPYMCFSVGSYAASLKSASSPLLSLFKSVLGIDLTVLGSGGIASLDGLEVPLVGLAAALGVGTPDELAEVNTTVAGFIKAAATALDGQGHTAEANLLRNEIAAKILPSRDKPFKVGDVLKMGAGGGGALDAGVNVLDLLSLPLFVASKGHAVSIPGATVGLPGLADLRVEVTITSPPQIACGRPGQAVARSVQADVKLNGDLLKVLAGVTDPELTVTISLADAVGRLESIQCRPGEGNVAKIETTSATGTVGVDLALNVKLLFIPVAGGVKVGPIGLLTKTQTLDLAYPPPPSTGLPTASMSPRLDAIGLSSAQVKPYDGLLGAVGLILNPILSGLVQPVLGSLDSLLIGLLNPVLTLLGLNIGGADVAATSQSRCDTPNLVG